MKFPPRLSVEDLVVGCPQAQTGSLPGRLFLIFPQFKTGEILGYRELPSETDDRPFTSPLLQRLDEFGAALAPYTDIDENGLKEIVVGTPGDSDNGVQSGAIYILFLRRRRHHGPVFNFLRFILLVTLFSWCGLTSCILGIAYFFWYYRRRPDIAEIIVKESGFKIHPEKSRPKYIKNPNAQYVTEYTI